MGGSIVCYLFNVQSTVIVVYKTIEKQPLKQKPTVTNYLFICIEWLYKYQSNVFVAKLFIDIPNSMYK